MHDSWPINCLRGILDATWREKFCETGKNGTKISCLLGLSTSDVAFPDESESAGIDLRGHSIAQTSSIPREAPRQSKRAASAGKEHARRRPDWFSHSFQSSCLSSVCAPGRS